MLNANEKKKERNTEGNEQLPYKQNNLKRTPNNTADLWLRDTGRV